jgi:hypothetical protein
MLHALMGHAILMAWRMTLCRTLHDVSVCESVRLQCGMSALSTACGQALWQWQGPSGSAGKTLGSSNVRAFSRFTTRIFGLLYHSQVRCPCLGDSCCCALLPASQSKAQPVYARAAGPLALIAIIPALTYSLMAGGCLQWQEAKK